MKILHIVGARPNFMKIAPIASTPPFDKLRALFSTGLREMAQYPQEFERILAHTGQHYDAVMSQVFFDELELPVTDIHLEVGCGSHAAPTAVG